MTFQDSFLNWTLLIGNRVNGGEYNAHHTVKVLFFFSLFTNMYCHVLINLKTIKMDLIFRLQSDTTGKSKRSINMFSSHSFSGCYHLLKLHKKTKQVSHTKMFKLVRSLKPQRRERIHRVQMAQNQRGVKRENFSITGESLQFDRWAGTEFPPRGRRRSQWGQTRRTDRSWGSVWSLDTGKLAVRWWRFGPHPVPEATPHASPQHTAWKNLQVQRRVTEWAWDNFKHWNSFTVIHIQHLHR